MGKGPGWGLLSPRSWRPFPASFSPKTSQAVLEAVPPLRLFPHLPCRAVLAAESNHGAPAVIGKEDPRCPSTERPPHTSPATFRTPATFSTPARPSMWLCHLHLVPCLHTSAPGMPFPCCPVNHPSVCKSQPQDSLGSVLEGAPLDCFQFSGTKGGFGPERLWIKWRNRGR